MKVIPRIFGGLGNQLFAYSAARRLALTNNAELVLDNVSGFKYDYQFQQSYQLDHFRIQARSALPSERLEPCSRFRRYVLRTVNNLLPFERRNYIQQKGNEFDSRLLAIKCRGALYLEGYWQSERYFKDIEKTIRSDLQIVAPTDASNLEAERNIRGSNAVAIHVRFFDSPSGVSTNNTPKDYYSRAITLIINMVPNAHFFLFSDNPNAARKLVALPESRITLINNNNGLEKAYADMWLMSLCKHFIIANSTFSWWGAWLSEHEKKIIIAPGFTLKNNKNAWGFDGLIPDAWIKL